MWVWILPVAALFFLACASPEVGRTRGGGQGADIGNRGDPIEMHGGAEPFYKTPELIGRQAPAASTSPLGKQASGR